MINQNDLNQIKNILDLDDIFVIQKIEIICKPKKQDLDFVTKLIQIEKELKQLGPNISIKIVEEGEVVNDSIIEIPFASA